MLPVNHYGFSSPGIMKKDKSRLSDSSLSGASGEEPVKPTGSASGFPATKAEWQHILADLSAHQVELEMQKEQLQYSMDEIQKEHKRFNDLYDFAPVGYLTLSADSTIREANLTAASMFSLGRNELKGVRFRSLIAKADLSAFNSMMQRAFKSGEFEYCEVMLKRFLAPEEATSLQRTFRLDAIISETMPECRLTLTDISDTRRAVEALKNKEAQYRRLFEAAQEGILILDYQTARVIEANPFIADLLGLGCDEIIGKEMWEIGVFVDKEHAQKTYLELQSKNYLHYRDISLHPKSGGIIDVDFKGYVYNVGDEKAIQCFIRDITIEKKVREYEKTFLISSKETIDALAGMVEIRDHYTAGHQERVAEIAVAIGKELHLSPNALEGLHMSSILHDIGKVTIPTEILVKATPLSEPEKDMLRTHSQAGYNVLKNVHFPWPIALNVLQHHERLDGSGYPNRLKGDSISEEARIIAVADTVEAMTGARSYRPAVGIDKALRHIQLERGRLFDPAVVDVCVRLFREKKFSFSARPVVDSPVPKEMTGPAQVYKSL